MANVTVTRVDVRSPGGCAACGEHGYRRVWQIRLGKGQPLIIRLCQDCMRSLRAQTRSS